MTYPVPTEHVEQMLVCNWIDARYPDLVWFAVPNGAKLGGTPGQ